MQSDLRPLLAYKGQPTRAQKLYLWAENNKKARRYVINRYA